MEHNHHHHAPKITSLNKAFIIGIILNFSYVIFQIVVGFRINSLSLLSDAAHNFADVVALGLSLLAFKLASVKATEKYTFGYKKASILVALFNALLLLISVGAIGYEAILRFFNPEPQQGLTIAIVSGVGILINGISAFQFFRDKDSDLNVKSAFSHLAADAVVSLGLVVGGILIHFTGWIWIDPVLSLIVALVIIWGTWSLMKDTLRLSMDGVPNDIDLEKVRQEILESPEVASVHHIHVWAMSTTENALTAHIVLKQVIDFQNITKLKQHIKHHLEHVNIHHATLEFEVIDDGCKEDC
ncbi:MAG: cation transporter [Arcicella sp.]|nr:cation transporter [Arcicella sp.]